MTIMCTMLGHKRSISRASYDPIYRRWFSDCKRCYAILERQRKGVWLEVCFEPIPGNASRMAPGGNGLSAATPRIPRGPG